MVLDMNELMICRAETEHRAYEAAKRKSGAPSPNRL